MKKKNNKSGGKRSKSGKKLTEQAGLAMKQEFYLEAVWILSSIIEKKLKKCMDGLETRRPGNSLSLEQTIKRLKYLHRTGKDPLFTAQIGLPLIDEIRHWKNQRNNILKDMQDIHVSKIRLERQAEEGIRLMKEWNRAHKQYKSARTDPG